MENPYTKAAENVTSASMASTIGKAAVNVESSLGVNPDKEAQHQRLAKNIQTPIETVRNDPDSAMKTNSTKTLKEMDLANNYPTLGRFLTDRNKAVLASDDLDVLGTVERDIKAKSEKYGSITAYYGPEPSVGSVMSGLGTSFTTGFGLMKAGLNAMAADALGFKTESRRALRDAELLNSDRDFNTPNFQSSTAQGLYGGAASLIQNAPGLALSVATANPAPAIGMASFQVQTESYSKYRNRGATPTEALIGSSGEGLVEGATELLPMGFIVDRFGKGAAKEFLGGLLARELPTEQVATVLQDAIDTAVANPDKTWGEYFAERPDAAYQTALGTLVQTGALGSVHLAASRFGNNRAIENTSEEVQFIEKIHKTAQASKLRQRDAATFEQFVKEASEEGPITDVYIDAGALAQSGIDTSELSDETKKQITDAREVGGSVRIPIEEYAARVTGIEGSEVLLDHLKLSPNSMSKLEAEEYMQTEGATLQAEVEQVLAKRDEDDAFTASRSVVEQNLTEQLNQTKRFTADVNQNYAKLASAYYATQADRLGITPEEMYQKYPLKVQSVAPTGLSFADFKQVDDTAFKKWFKDSKVVDEKGEPLKVFHGTRADFDTFDSSFQQSREGFWFSTAEVAGKFAGAERGPNDTTEGANIMPVYLSIDNPLEHNPKDFAFMTLDEIIQEAKAGGHDGITFTNQKTGDKTYMAFDPTQIKSVHNEGTYDPQDPNILKQDELQELFDEFDKMYAGFTDDQKAALDAATDKIQEQNAVAEERIAADQAKLAERAADVQTFRDRFGDRSGLAAWNETRIDDMLKTYSHTNGVESKSRVGFVDPVNFVLATAQLPRAVEVSAEAGELDQQRLENDPQSPYVIVENGEIIGHEGRHRMIALAKEGVRRAPVVVRSFDTGYTDFADAPTEQTYGRQRFLEGGPSELDLAVEGMIPLSWDNKRKITDAMPTKDDGALVYQDPGKNRGSFNPSTNTITLLGDADLSTFLHEMGHFMLEMQVDIATQENAPQAVKDDVDTLLKWYKLDGKTPEERLANWTSKSLEQQRENHEQFARGFEAYLLDGKAPSPELRVLFRRFRDWMLNIYRDLVNLNVTLNKDVRGVFDRMLATQAEIEASEQLSRFAPLFTAAQEVGMSPEEFADYQSLGADATDEAVETLERRNLRDMQWLSNARAKGIAKMQKEAESKRKTVRAEVTAEVTQEPTYKAMEYLKRGTIEGESVGEGFNKLSIEELQAVYGKDTPLYKSMVEKFGYGKYGMLGRDNGVHPDQIAELFGFSSGDHLVKTLLEAEDMKTKIDGLTDQRMLEKYGDLNDPASIEDAVMAALRNDTRAKFIAAEVTALNNAVGGKKFLAKAAKQFAAEMISRQKIRDVRPAQYESAETKAAKAAEKAFRAGDTQLAAMQKRNQLIQLYAARGSREAIVEVEKGLRYFKKFDRRKKSKLSIDPEYIDQIDALLESYDLKPITNKSADRRVSLREWVAQQEEAGLQPDIPDAILDAARKKSYKEMTVEEFRGLRDAVRQIEHMGRLKNKLLTAKNQRDFNEAKAEVVKTILANAPKRKPNLRTRTNAGGTLKEMGVNYLAMHRKMASVLREMDGFQDGGALWEYIIRPMNEAGDREAAMREKATEKLAEISKTLIEDGDILGGKGQYFESVGISLNREERISIALNLGNEGNTQRLLDGEGWTMDKLKPVLDTLTKKDWDFVQNVWDYFESYRAEIGAKEKRVTGREPEWVEPRAVETNFGSYRGGYYPIKYDPKPSGRTQQFLEAEEAKQMMRSAFTASTTRRSFTKSRAEKVTGRPLMYSFSGIYQGTEEIIHDLTHHEWLIDANKFIRDNEFDKAVRNSYGPEFADLIRNAVKDVARGNQPAQNVFERGVNHIRIGATVAGLGWNFTTAFLQPLGLTNSMVRIGPGWVVKGINAWLKSPVDLVNEIYEKSDFMRLRAKTMQREINEIQNRLQQPGAVQTGIGKVIGADKAQQSKEWIKWSLFLAIQKLQMVADVPTWQGTYEKAIANGDSDARASALADQSVIDSQGGGQTKDLSAIQRGGPLLRLWTNFYSYFNVVYNLNSEIKNRTDWKDPYQVAVAARDYLLLMVVPAILGQAIREGMSGDGDDDAEETAKKLAAEQISYLFGTMVGLREASNVAQRIAGVSQFKGGYSGPAGLRFLQELDKLGSQVSQGDLDKALRKSTINTAGVLFHLPSGQINKTWDGIEAVADGKAGPAAIITGPPR